MPQSVAENARRPFWVPKKCERLGVRAKKKVFLPVAVSYNLAVAGVVGDSDTQSALLMSSLLHNHVLVAVTAENHDSQR